MLQNSALFQLYTTVSFSISAEAVFAGGRHSLIASRNGLTDETLRRGEQNTCGTISRDDRYNKNNNASSHVPPAHATAPTPEPSLPSGEYPRESRTDDGYEYGEELVMLRRRVRMLEGQLQHQINYSSPPPQASPSSAPVPEQRPMPVPTPIPTAAFQQGQTNNTFTQDAPACSPSSNNNASEDAASILEFLAWGRRKNPELPPIASPEAMVHQAATADLSSAGAGDLRLGGHGCSTDSNNHMMKSALGDIPDMSVVQLLLPERGQALDLILWHEQNLLWYHCSYHAPSLRNQFESFYDTYDGQIEHPNMNLQWVAFLFAVLASTITCLPTVAAERLGFGDEERVTLSKRWFQAAITCLNRADFAANYSILSIQAIATLTLPAHALGFSNLQSVYLAAAVRIAQSFGLHRLRAEAPGGLVEKEAGRRAWMQLCSQDWFSLPFSDTYLINPIYSKSDLPLNCHDEDLVPLPDSLPTVTGYSRFLASIASIMPRLQDGLMSCNTMFTKYEQVIKWDKQLRNIAIARRPRWLCNGPVDPSWPPFVHWARRSLAISSSHKIIMIHRSFLSESFTNPAFEFTRRTCLAASKTIVTEYKHVVEEDGPVLWIYDAFAVAASIIIILDALYRDDTHEAETGERLQLARDVVEILKRHQHNMLAVRGVKLLTALFDAASAAASSSHRKRTAEAAELEPEPESESGPGSGRQKRRPTFDVPDFVKTFCEGRKAQAQPAHVASITDRTAAAAGLPILTDTFFEPGAFEDFGVENLLYLASQDFYP